MRIVADAGPPRRAAIGGGPSPDSVSWLREPSTGSISIPPRTARYAHICPSAGGSTRRRFAGLQRVALPVAARRRDDGADRLDDEPAGGLDRRRVAAGCRPADCASACAAAIDGTGVGTPRWAKPAPAEILHRRRPPGVDDPERARSSGAHPTEANDRSCRA